MAQDAAQDAFISAYKGLPRLQAPGAFPGWLRRIVVREGNRMGRRAQIPTTPIEEALAVPSTEPAGTERIGADGHQNVTGA